DNEYEQPILRKALYPIDERMRAVLEEFAKTDVPARSSTISAAQSNQVFGSGYLLARAREMEPGLDGWQAFHTDILKTCAELFAHGPEWTREPSMYSLHRWNECVRNIGDHEQSGAACTVADALGWVLNRVAEESRYDILALARSIWRRVHGTA